MLKKDEKECGEVALQTSLEGFYFSLSVMRCERWHECVCGGKSKQAMEMGCW